MARMSDKDMQEKWKAESDAHTLAEAEVIRGDNERHEKAQAAGKRMAEEAREKADAMERISKAKMTYGKSEMKPKKE